MTRWIIQISDDNAAFDDEPATELGRILMDLAHRAMFRGTLEGAILDINGNTCGGVAVVLEDG